MKRLLDLALTIPALIILSPVMIVIALWVRFDSSGPALFRQVRVGRYGREFFIFKFRTMHVDTGSSGPLVSRGDDPRITRCGRLLRRRKLDELPQLFNVLTGEMSLVGPRPEVPKYVAAYADAYREILTVRPGLTDFAALEFSDENELLRGVENPEGTYLEEILPAKIELYRAYLARQSIRTDMFLIWETLRKVLARRPAEGSPRKNGANFDGHH